MFKILKFINKNGTILNIKGIRLAPLCSKTTSDNKNNDYVPVYKFPLINAAGLLNRAKLYQTIISASSIPLTVILSQMNVIHSDYAVATGAIGLSSCIVLYSFGYLTDKLVGFVYLNEKDGKVKLSYVDFWGKRKDDVIDLDDLTPLNELPVSFMDPLFLTVRRYSVKDKLKLNLKFGQVLCEDGFTKVFLQKVA